MICAECLRCANYMVSEVGCYGSSSPCNSEIEVEYDEETRCNRLAHTDCRGNADAVGSV